MSTHSNIFPSETDNINYLLENKFVFILDRCPKTNFMVTKVKLPEIVNGAEKINTMFATPYNLASSKLEYSELEITFFVDEDLTNYKELLNWLKSNVNEGYNISKESYRKSISAPLTSETSEIYAQSSDASLITLTNSQNPNKIISFQRILITRLSEISLTSLGTSNIECSATFTVDNMEL